MSVAQQHTACCTTPRPCCARLIDIRSLAPLPHREGPQVERQVGAGAVHFWVLIPLVVAAQAGAQRRARLRSTLVGRTAIEQQLSACSAALFCRHRSCVCRPGQLLFVTSSPHLGLAHRLPPAGLYAIKVGQAVVVVPALLRVLFPFELRIVLHIVERPPQLLCLMHKGRLSWLWWQRLLC